MNHVRGCGRSSRLAWVLAAALTMGSSAPAMAEQISSPEVGELTPGADPSGQVDVETKPPAPTPTPSPDPSPTPTPSPEPSPTPTQTPGPSPQPTPDPSPDSTPAPPKPAPDPPSSVDTGFVGPAQSPDSLASPEEQSVGLEEPSDTESVQQHTGAAVASESSFTESVTSILDQLVSVDAPVEGPRLSCRASGCGSPPNTTRSKAFALASICIILAVAGASGVRARRRRSFDGSSVEDA
jgi:outer membrane biosynthesis protein TonB